ncbi:MAG TPA: hypothetical protein VIM07_15110 [Chitinophagaceae bacterium]
MLFKESNMKFIHWEYNEEYLYQGYSGSAMFKGKRQLENNKMIFSTIIKYSNG